MRKGWTELAIDGLLASLTITTAVSRRRRRYKKAPAAIAAAPINPPTTPPAIAPAFDDLVVEGPDEPFGVGDEFPEEFLKCVPPLALLQHRRNDTNAEGGAKAAAAFKTSRAAILPPASNDLSGGQLSSQPSTEHTHVVGGPNHDLE